MEHDLFPKTGIRPRLREGMLFGIMLKQLDPMQIDLIYLFTSVHGRITREQFWIGLFFVVLAEIAGHWLAFRIQGDKLDSIVGLALNYPEFVLAVKRANDRDLPAWQIAVFFIGDAVVGFLSLQGLGSTDALALMQLVLDLYLLVLIADLGFRRGTVGPNRFGPDPLAGNV
jgi:uncharacterized membrane protein YhaH (DUF805 family)